jgi:hypothetical protein
MKYELTDQNLADITQSLHDQADAFYAGSRGGVCSPTLRTAGDRLNALAFRLTKDAQNTPHEETTEGNCRICAGSGPVRHISLYVSGSEGLTLCHDCEMAIVENVRSLMLMAIRGRKTGYKAAKRVHEAKALQQTPGLGFDSVKAPETVAALESKPGKRSPAMDVEIAETIREAMSQFNFSAHVSGDPSNPNNHNCAATTWRRCEAAIARLSEQAEGYCGPTDGGFDKFSE